MNRKIIETLKSGKIHIVEPDLQEVYNKALNSGKLIPIGDLKDSDVFIICVPTPFKKNEKKK